ncbi:MAG: ISAs1 family transposase [Lachnospiraceae bacterium]|nr:ISAs1 family transposase [Lachnospiraceae bacterium]
MDVIAKEYGFSRSVELLYPADWKEPLGENWQTVLKSAFQRRMKKECGIDLKGLRATARKIRGERTLYILNAIDTASGLVIGQLAIQEKSSEMSAIPALVDLIEMEGSTVTIDAIGTTEKIMDAICERGGDFVLQVQRGCYSEAENNEKTGNGMNTGRNCQQRRMKAKLTAFTGKTVNSNKFFA